MKSGKNKNVGISEVLWHKRKYVVIVLATATLFISVLTGCGKENETVSNSSSAASQTGDPSSLSSQASSASSSQESNQTPANFKSLIENYTNDQGYSFSLTVKIWDPIQNAKVGQTTHPDSSASVLQSSSFNASTDLVVPAAFVIKDTTQGFSLPSSMYAYMEGRNSDNLTIEQFFVNGAQDTDISSYNRFGVQWGNLSYNQTVESNFFIIIHNYFTPNNPKGDTSLLDSIDLKPAGPINAAEYKTDWNACIFLSGRTAQ